MRTVPFFLSVRHLAGSAVIILLSGCASSSLPPRELPHRSTADSKSLVQLPDEAGYSLKYMPQPDDAITRMLQNKGLLSKTDQNLLLDRLYQQYQQWDHVPHRLGGLSKNGIDCSGFAMLTYRDLFGIQLPRTSTAQAATGRDIHQSQLQTGDLVFFKINARTRHVGIYLQQDEFLHVSSKQGVKISSLRTPYWERRYWKSVRHHDILQNLARLP